MLKRLLLLINQKGLRSQVELAHEIGVSPMLVRVMAEQLVRQGYLVEVSQDFCRTYGCTSCPEGGNCSSMAGLQAVWVVTEKGKNIAEKT